MFGDEKSIKDTSPTASLMVKDMSISISYTKTSKLVTALYMVTDIMDKEEPLRGKLRTLGVEIISDIYKNPATVKAKAGELMSFLDIASAINLISEMNANILKKEFILLDQSIEEYLKVRNRALSFGDFFQHPERNINPEGNPYLEREERSLEPSKRQPKTRIGVQKGSTLLRALSDKTSFLSDNNLTSGPVFFEDKKKERRKDIRSILKDRPEGMTIKDINNEVKDKKFMSLINSGEKTLQRELISMVKDGVLNKKGEKRWSRYYIITS